MSDSKRNETGLLCDVLGLESLVDEITSKQQQQQQQLQSSSSSSSSTGTATTTAVTATPSAILGPFYRADAPLKPLGSSILLGLFPPLPPTPAQSLVSSSPPPLYTSEATAADLHASCLPLLARISGRVRSATTGTPITSGAMLEVWQSAPNGLYEQQDDLQPEMNLRGRFATTTSAAFTNNTFSEAGAEADANARGKHGGGHYSFVCLKPTAYPIPDDGPAGRLLGLLDRHPFRPGHLHFVVSAPGFRTLTTQVFDRDDPYVRGDAAFAVKEELLVEFRPLRGEEGSVGDDGVESNKEKTVGGEVSRIGMGSGSVGGNGGNGGNDGETERKKERDGEQLWKQKYKPKWYLEFDFSLVEL